MSAYGIAGAIAEEVFSSIRTVMAFGGQTKEIKRYNNKLVFARDINIKRSFFSGIGFGLLWFFIYASYALAFWYGVGLVLDDKKLPKEDRSYDPATMVTVSLSIWWQRLGFLLVLLGVFQRHDGVYELWNLFSLLRNVQYSRRSRGEDI